MLDWNAYRKELKGRIGEIGKLSPDTVKGYATLANAGAQTNHLDAKTRELIALAVAVTTRCDGCITVHVDAALKHGANREECWAASRAAWTVSMPRSRPSARNRCCIRWIWRVRAPTTMPNWPRPCSASWDAGWSAGLCRPFPGLTPFELADPASFARAVHVTLTAPAWLTQACLPLLRQRDDAALVLRSMPPNGWGRPIGVDTVWPSMACAG